MKFLTLETTWDRRKDYETLAPETLAKLIPGRCKIASPISSDIRATLKWMPVNPKELVYETVNVKFGVWKDNKLVTTLNADFRTELSWRTTHGYT